MNKIQLLTYFGFKSEYTATECKTINELYKVCWWAEKAGLTWASGHHFFYRSLIKTLAENIDKGRTVYIRPARGTYLTMTIEDDPNEGREIIPINQFIRKCKEIKYENRL